MNEPELLRAIKELKLLEDYLIGRQASADEEVRKHRTESECYRIAGIHVANQRYDLEKEAGIKK